MFRVLRVVELKRFLSPTVSVSCVMIATNGAYHLPADTIVQGSRLYPRPPTWPSTPQTNHDGHKSIMGPQHVYTTPCSTIPMKKQNVNRTPTPTKKKHHAIDIENRQCKTTEKQLFQKKNTSTISRNPGAPRPPRPQSQDTVGRPNQPLACPLRRTTLRAQPVAPMTQQIKTEILSHHMTSPIVTMLDRF